MKRERNVHFFIIPMLLLLLLSFSPECVLAKERSIYVGDLINVRVSAKDYSESDLRDKFKAFEIVGITEDADAFVVTLRSFEPGEKTIRLGNKELKISIKSTLKEIKRNGIFEGDLKPEKEGFKLAWQTVFYILLALFAAFGGLSLWRFIKRKKNIALSPFQRFNKILDKLVIKEAGYFVKLTLALKEYFEVRYSCSIKGKTSAEIIEEIRNIPELEQRLSDIRSWLEECDNYKFAGISATAREKLELRNKLMEIVIQIDKAKKED